MIRWATNNPFLAFLILAGVVLIFYYLIKKRAEKNSKKQQTPIPDSSTASRSNNPHVITVIPFSNVSNSASNSNTRNSGKTNPIKNGI